MSCNVRVNPFWNGTVTFRLFVPSVFLQVMVTVNLRHQFSQLISDCVYSHCNRLQTHHSEYYAPEQIGIELGFRFFARILQIRILHTSTGPDTISVSYMYIYTFKVFFSFIKLELILDLLCSCDRNEREHHIRWRCLAQTGGSCQKYPWRHRWTRWLFWKRKMNRDW